MQGNYRLTIIPKKETRVISAIEVEPGYVIKYDNTFYMRTTMPFDKTGAFIELGEGRAASLSRGFDGFLLVKCSLREE